MTLGQRAAREKARSGDAVTVARAAADYLEAIERDGIRSLADRARALAWLTARHGARPLAELDSASLRRDRDALSREDDGRRSASTVNSYL